MKSKSILLQLLLVSPIALSAAGYQCQECKATVLSTDIFCPNCGTSASLSSSLADDVYLSIGPIVAPYVGLSIPYPNGNARLRGVSVALYNIYDRGASGIMLSAGANGSNGCALSGVGVTGVFNGGDELFGLFIAGFANCCRGTTAGVFAAGIFNYTRECRGAQVGLFNIAGRLAGVQIGFVNHADKSDWCVQIGGFNILSDNAVKCLPLINGYF